MQLQYPDGREFASGAAPYTYRPATQWETSPRIMLDLLIGGFETSAFVDTGGVYLLCSPIVATYIAPFLTENLFSVRLLLRGRWRSGDLFRVPITLPATHGFTLSFEAVTFIPKSEDEWDKDLPCILGMQGCLDRIRFAIDPAEDIFYFGELTSSSL